MEIEKSKTKEDANTLIIRDKGVTLSFLAVRQKKGKHNWWFYQDRNASSQGTKISVGIKYKMKFSLRAL